MTKLLTNFSKFVIGIFFWLFPLQFVLDVFDGKYANSQMTKDLKALLSALKQALYMLAIFTLTLAVSSVLIDNTNIAVIVATLKAFMPLIILAALIALSVRIFNRFLVRK